MAEAQKRRRTRAQSRAFKARIVGLRKKGKSIVEIGRLVGVSRQYVSLVLIEAGLKGRIKVRQARPVRSTVEVAEVEADIARLEGQGQYGLAGLLRAAVKRRSGNATDK